MKVLVTGGSSGIGLEIAKKFLSQKHIVAINYLPESYDKVLTDSLLEDFKDSVSFLGFDVTSERDVKREVSRFVKKHGTIDVLVNNAGIYPRIPWKELSLSQWNHIILVNLTSHFIVTKEVSKYMMNSNFGRIVNISSKLAEIGRKELVAYASAKSGLKGFTKSLSLELGIYNITVNSILPGSIQVGREAEVVSDFREAEQRMMFRQAVKRRGIPKDIANIVYFLAQEESSFITGQMISVDGGWRN